MILSLLPPNAPTQADAPEQSKRAGKAKTNGKHKGVTILKPRSPGGALSLRWRDLETRKQRTELLPGVTDRKAARALAIHKSQKLTIAKHALADVGRCAVREIAKECAHYLDEASAAARKGPRKGLPLADTTVARYRVTLEGFEAWCTSQGLVTLRDLTADKLSDWRTSCRKRVMPGGELRMMATINAELKPVRQMLTLARRKGRFESLDSDAIAGALERFPEPDAAPVCLSVSAIRAMLRALIDRDVTRYAKHAPAFAIALLGGLRRGEVATLTVGQARFNEPTEYDPTATHAILHDVDGKTGLRDVEVLPYSPLLLELLRALADGHDAGEVLHRVDYEQLGAESERLARLGGELKGFMFKTLRSTCASYQGPIPGDLKGKADRLGHTLAVAEQYYLAVPRGTPRVAASLDAVMQCEPELRAIIDAVTRLHERRASRAQRTAK